MVLEIDDRIQIPLRELHFSFSRSSGAGGQNVNKVNTRATLRWNVAASPSVPDAVRDRFVSRYRRRINAEGVLVLHSQRFRDQGRNVADCLAKLRTMVAAVVEPPPRRKRTRPTRSAVERRLREKRERSERKARRARPTRDESR
jgi:ribosome-associated protein